MSATKWYNCNCLTKKLRLKDKIRYAQALAEFANLKPQDIAKFCALECEGSAAEDAFVPPNWFDYYPTDSGGKPLDKQWQINQTMLREAWQKEFRIGQFELMSLLTSVFDPNNLTDVMFSSSHRPAFATVSEMPKEMYPYQQAVMFLVEQNWREMLCGRCRAQFAATHNRAKYCGIVLNEEGDTCASLARKETHQRDYHKHRETRNRIRRRKYAKVSISKRR